MHKLSKTVVMLCGALVSGCQGVEGEQSGGADTEASIASVSQAVVSPELEASLSCVEAYANAGTCDWEHWSELWEACQTYLHPELEDGVFMDEVQFGNCTAANWPALREQLITPRPPRVRVREACWVGSQVLQEAESNGCYSLAEGAGASYVDVPLGKVVTLHAGADCTGDAVTVDTDANLCETSFESGAGANDTVRSLRVQDVVVPPTAYRYSCAAEESTCVENYNGRVGALNQRQTAKVIRVTLDGRTTASLTSIRNNVRDLSDFYSVASHGQMSLEIIDSQTVEVTSANCQKAKNQALQKSSSGAFLTVFVLPSGVCSVSNAGSNNIFLKGNLFRDYAHEAGHVLGLGHGHSKDPNTGKVNHYGDSSTYMGSNASDNYNLPQLHWLGWTAKEDLIKVNSAVDSGGSIDVTLRPVGRNAENASNLPLGAVWEIPGSDQRLFIAVPKGRANGSNQIEGGTVFVYRAPKCVGCTGMAMGSMVLARFEAKNTQEREVNGLFIKGVGYTSQIVKVDGKNVEDFTSVTVRLRR
ncbi:hypothetical protein P2318_15950 [Myxococcaceae bacterium GXIMD 01537]